MVSDNDIKLPFAIKALTEYFRMVERDMKALALKKKVGITQQGINSISYNTLQQSNSVLGTLSFKEYLRFVDMGVGKSHPLGGLAAMRVSLQSKHKEGYIQVKDNTRKAKKIYSKSAYGNLTWLQNNLLYGLTEETRNLIIKELEDERINN